MIPQQKKTCQKQRVGAGFQLYYLFLLFISVLSWSLFSGTAWAQQRGILGQPAPSLQVTEWRNLPEGQTTLDISDFKGKVIYLYAFQNW